ESEVTSGPDAPELVERKHLAVRINPIDATRIGDHGGDLRRLVRVRIIFLRVQEVALLQDRVQALKGGKHLQPAAELALIAQSAQCLREHCEMRRAASKADVRVTD